MAKNASDHITYYLRIEQHLQNDLSALRKWSNLKIAFEGEYIWISNFELYQFESTEVKSIPYKKLYYQKGEKLFPHNSLLPDRIAPSLLWTPIERGIPVTIENYNHNFFGFDQKTDITLISSEHPRNSKAILTSIISLKSFVFNAPEVRLTDLYYCIINNTKALVIGSPILPVPGITYWGTGNQLIPTGYEFEIMIIADKIDKIMSPSGADLVIWNKNSSYSTVCKELLLPLTISSLKRTLMDIELQQNLTS